MTIKPDIIAQQGLEVMTDRAALAIIAHPPRGLV
jgi:hypothetical protein